MKTGIGAIITLAAATLVGCSAAETDEPAVEDSDALIAELKLDDAVIQFYEYEPGEVGVAAGYPIEGTAPALPDGSLAEIFHAAAPEKEIPIALIEADRRVEQARALELELEPDEAIPESIDAGITPEPADLGGNPGQLRQGLTSSIGWDWFQAQFCNGWGSAKNKGSWCFPVATSYAFAEGYRKNARAVSCGDTGYGIMKAYRNGREVKSLTIGYAQCWAYAFWGKKTYRRFSLRDVQQSLRFAGMMHNSEFIVAPPGWL